MITHSRCSRPEVTETETSKRGLSSQIAARSTMEEEYVLYYEDYLKIREANRCWKEYWVRLQNTTLVLF